jgi:hypothetical protein
LEKESFEIGIGLLMYGAEVGGWVLGFIYPAQHMPIYASAMHIEACALGERASHFFAQGFKDEG